MPLSLSRSRSSRLLMSLSLISKGVKVVYRKTGDSGLSALASRALSFFWCFSIAFDDCLLWIRSTYMPSLGAHPKSREMKKWRPSPLIIRGTEPTSSARKDTTPASLPSSTPATTKITAHPPCSLAFVWYSQVRESFCCEIDMSFSLSNPFSFRNFACELAHLPSLLSFILLEPIRPALLHRGNLDR